MYGIIKEICDKRGINISQLEKKAGLGNGTISGWKDGDVKLSNLDKVAKALDMKTETLIKRRKECQ